MGGNGREVHAEPDPQQPAGERSVGFRAAEKKIGRRKKPRREIDASTGGEAEHEPLPDRPFTLNSLLSPGDLFLSLEELEPTTLVGFASTIASVARWALEQRLRLPSVRGVWTTSEVLSPDGADAIREAFGCEPLTIYASNEFGFMAWEPEKDAALRFDSDRIYVEHLRRDSETPATQGEQSRLVITDLLNDTMPLIRYDIGDVARQAKPVQIGTGLRCAAITDLSGKEADQLEPPDGRTVTTFQILGVIKDSLPNAQYRFLGISQSLYILQYRPGVGFSPAVLPETIAALRKILGDIEIVPQQVETISRENSGKLRPIVNLGKLPLLRRWELAGRFGCPDLIGLSPPQIGEFITREALETILPSPKGEIRLDDELYADLALDSRRFLRLITVLERKLGHQIDDDDLLDTDLITVGDLVGFVTRFIPVPSAQNV